MKEYTVKEVADLVGKHEETVKRCFAQVSCPIFIETAKKKDGDF
ncbi:hypothetical protein ACE38V_19160 [Cytobacillus sp. Hz8]